MSTPRAPRRWTHYCSVRETSLRLEGLPGLEAGSGGGAASPGELTSSLAGSESRRKDDREDCRLRALTFIVVARAVPRRSPGSDPYAAAQAPSAGGGTIGTRVLERPEPHTFACLRPPQRQQRIPCNSVTAGSNDQ